MNDQSKVTADHLRRDAYLYVRQSSLYQVANNTESSRRQYDLRGRAVALGWPTDSVIVIDVDQGQSGASAADRAGFQRLVADVSLGKAGIVLAWNARGSRETTPTGTGCWSCARCRAR
jgi:DNA invertase Pin-like site-specific DNA recombinase